MWRATNSPWWTNEDNNLFNTIICPVFGRRE